MVNQMQRSVVINAEEKSVFFLMQRFPNPFYAKTLIQALERSTGPNPTILSSEKV